MSPRPSRARCKDSFPELSFVQLPWLQWAANSSPEPAASAPQDELRAVQYPTMGRARVTARCLDPQERSWVEHKNLALSRTSLPGGAPRVPTPELGVLPDSIAPHAARSNVSWPLDVRGQSSLWPECQLEPR